jgi:hypothetical protein
MRRKQTETLGNPLTRLYQSSPHPNREVLMYLKRNNLSRWLSVTLMSLIFRSFMGLPCQLDA